MRNRAVLCLLVFLPFFARAESPKPVTDSAKLTQIAPRMKTFIDKGIVAGTVTLVERNGEILHLEAAGYQDIDKKTPMRTDTIFEIMSMTKPVTSVAIMILVEEGAVCLYDPVEKYIPEFRGMWVIESRGPGDKTRTLKRPSRPITVYDLLTHTSGMPEMPPESMGAVDFYFHMDKTLAEAVRIYGQQPLEFEPGTKWSYSNTGMATLGRIVEVASGMAYERFVDERIFKPLGMVDSSFYPVDGKRERIASVYSLQKGKLVSLGDAIYRKGSKYPMPEGGMYSTARDMAAFYQMMLNHGTYNGHKILSKAAVETMTMVHTVGLPVGTSTAVGWGLGWSILRGPGATLTLSSMGTFGHGGAFGTQGWVDPAKNLVGVFMLQNSGGGSEPVHEAFREMTNAAVIQ